MYKKSIEKKSYKIYNSKYKVGAIHEHIYLKQTKYQTTKQNKSMLQKKNKLMNSINVKIYLYSVSPPLVSLRKCLGMAYKNAPLPK